jgi:protein-L-isoaspartate(D-aspartate) O-methyltransferase
MVAAQIEARGISDARVLAAMREIRRHEFVEASQRDHAYGDGPLPIGFGQTISQPYIVALMTALLDVKPSSRVLEIGAGSGYQTAILCKLCVHVYAIERVGELCTLALENLRKAGCKNFTLKNGDGTQGWPEHAPFARTLIAACSPAFPKVLLDSLAPGGLMIAPIGGRDYQELTLAAKDAAGAISYSRHGAVSFVPLLPGPARQSANE